LFVERATVSVDSSRLEGEASGAAAPWCSLPIEPVVLAPGRTSRHRHPVQGQCVPPRADVGRDPLRGRHLGKGIAPGPKTLEDL